MKPTEEEIFELFKSTCLSDIELATCLLVEFYPEIVTFKDLDERKHLWAPMNLCNKLSKDMHISALDFWRCINKVIEERIYGTGNKETT